MKKLPKKTIEVALPDTVGYNLNKNATYGSHTPWFKGQNQFFFVFTPQAAPFEKLLILAFEASSVISVNCTFLQILAHCV